MRARGTRATALLACCLAIAMAVSACSSSSDGTEGGATGAASESGGGGAPAGVRARSCGSVSGAGQVRVTGVGCALGRQLVAGWHKDPMCFSPTGASRTSCRLGDFTCLGATTDAGIAVTCAAPGRSVAFVAQKPG